MPLDHNPPDSDDTGIQAEDWVTQEPPEVPVPVIPAQEQSRPYFRRGWTGLLRWLAIPSACLGFGSVYCQVTLLLKADDPIALFLVPVRKLPSDFQFTLITLLMAAAAIPLGLLGYWLSRRELARIERELVYSRARLVTIESRRWALIGLVCGTLGVIVGVVVATLAQMR
jgi:hypothetical protein